MDLNAVVSIGPYQVRCNQEHIQYNSLFYIRDDVKKKAMHNSSLLDSSIPS